MTLRPSDDQTERLRRRAEAENRSMQAVVLDAIEEYIERRERHQRVTELSRTGAAFYREALDRLGKI